MSSGTNSPTYSHPSRNANIIEISEDSDDETITIQPKVELPTSPSHDSSKTSVLLNQINILDSQLTAIEVRNQHEGAYYQQKIRELEANSNHAFKYISEIQAYVERKIPSLETNLYDAQTNLQRAQQEIIRWRD